MLGENLKKVLAWSSSAPKLEEALYEETKGNAFQLSSTLLRDLARSGISYELIPVSSTTKEGMLDLSATITRQLSEGEEMEE